jgi:hypothetical protein
VGTIPPLKSNVKNTRKLIIFLPGNSLRESVYPSMAVSINPEIVPINVVSIEIPYARNIVCPCVAI